MTRQELNMLVEKLISIRDRYDFIRSDRDALADACNVIYDNIETIAEDGTKRLCFEAFKEYADEIRGKWIPVSERLPEADIPVLVYQTYYEGEPVTIGRFNSRGYWQWIKYDYSFQYGIDHFGIICPNSDFVEAWMPLPKPYEPHQKGGKE